MKLLEAKGEEAIGILAELMIPFAELAADVTIAHCLKSNQTYKAVMFALKKYPKTVLRFLAICEGVPYEEYKPTVLEIPARLMEVLNDPTVQALFFTPEQTTENYGGSATEITEVQEEM